MAAPEYVPVKPMDDVRTYESPPRRPDPWLAQRPGDLKTGQPRGVHFGNPGPDQGYALVLARRLETDWSSRTTSRSTTRSMAASRSR